MKKALCSFLAVMLAISFSACKNDLPETTLQFDDQAGKNEVEATTKTASSHQAATSGKEEAANKKETSGKEGTTGKDGLCTPIDPTDIYLLRNDHISLKMAEYYQYSFLTDVEKEAYRRIRVAVLSYDSVVEVSELNLSMFRKQQIVECFLADNPQYFWLSESYGIDGKGNICLSYCDGVNTDDSGYGNADRSQIDERRKAFHQAVFEILSEIDPAASQYEKELAIHDYITKTTSYEKTAETNPFVNGTMDSAYNAYGVLVEKSGVCSGYTKAFQYLCYLVGINSNRVQGYSHIWNTVQIEGEWYQVDVTWDDPIDPYGNSGDGDHDYFNLTAAEMYKVHPRNIDSFYNYLKVPECTATKYSYVCQR